MKKPCGFDSCLVGKHISRFYRNSPLASGKHTKNYGKSPFFMGQFTISMVIFHSYVKVPEGKWAFWRKGGPRSRTCFAWKPIVAGSQCRTFQGAPRTGTSTSIAAIAKTRFDLAGHGSTKSQKDPKEMWNRNQCMYSSRSQCCTNNTSMIISVDTWYSMIIMNL